MRVHLVHHGADAAFVEGLAPVLAAHRMETWPTPDGSDVAVVLASRSALRDGLGPAPSAALRSGVTILPVLLGDDLVPIRFPVPAKHIAHVTDAHGLLRVLDEHRKGAAAKIADSKRDLFGYGILLALLARDGA